MTANDFVKDYASALATQDWAAVAPLISEGASVVFSDGTVHRGKAEIKAAYERNFSAIKSEEYRIENVHWLMQTPESAAYQFDFFWTGLIGGKEASGAGRGTAVLTLENDRWVLVAEHLGSR